jgi:3-phosphoglycerate kinase
VHNDVRKFRKSWLWRGSRLHQTQNTALYKHRYEEEDSDEGDADAPVRQSRGADLAALLEDARVRDGFDMCHRRRLELEHALIEFKPDAAAAAVVEEVRALPSKS